MHRVFFSIDGKRCEMRSHPGGTFRFEFVVIYIYIYIYIFMYTYIFCFYLSIHLFVYLFISEVGVRGRSHSGMTGSGVRCNLTLAVR